MAIWYELKKVDPNLEMTEIADRTLRGGPALLLKIPKATTCRSSPTFRN